MAETTEQFVARVRKFGPDDGDTKAALAIIEAQAKEIARKDAFIERLAKALDSEMYAGAIDCTCENCVELRAALAAAKEAK